MHLMPETSKQHDDDPSNPRLGRGFSVGVQCLFSPSKQACACLYLVVMEQLGGLFANTRLVMVFFMIFFL